MSDLKTNLPEERIFQICEKYLGTLNVNPMGATEISKWLETEGCKCSRERVHKEVANGIRRGYVRLCPPNDFVIAERLADKFDLDLPKIRVVKTATGTPTAEHVATQAAEMLLEMIKNIADAVGRVHIGFGAGYTVQRIARSLSILLRAEEDVPALTIHALSSGFSVEDPTTAPVVFLSYFTDISPRIEFVGLFAPAVVRCDEYAHIKELPGVRPSFDRRGQIHIAISSMAQRSDPHGLLSKFMDMGGERGRSALREAGWVGDVHWRPFSTTGPILVDSEIRATTIFEIDELVERLKQPNKHNMLSVAPCNWCGCSKAEALLPLLTQPSLRAFDCLIIDAETARRALKPDQNRRTPG
jgi:DNA-binding transcriptional regulator LsrR (DeoR family)